MVKPQHPWRRGGLRPPSQSESCRQGGRSPPLRHGCCGLTIIYYKYLRILMYCCSISSLPAATGRRRDRRTRGREVRWPDARGRALERVRTDPGDREAGRSCLPMGPSSDGAVRRAPKRQEWGSNPGPRARATAKSPLHGRRKAAIWTTPYAAFRRLRSHHFVALRRSAGRARSHA